MGAQPLDKMSLRQAVASTSKLVSRRQLQPASPLACTCHVQAPAWLAHRRQTYASQAKGKTPIQQLRDEAIRPQLIRLVQGAEEGGGLSIIKQRDQVLRSIDRTRFWLVQVDEQALSGFEAQQHRAKEGQPIGICKLIGKKESFDKAKEKVAQQKAKRKQTSAMEEKEFQLTWGVSMNDLSHKLKRAQATLDKGGRVALVVTSPKGAKTPPRPEREMFVAMCTDSLKQNEGTDVSTWKDTEWLGGKTSVFLQGSKAS